MSPTQVIADRIMDEWMAPNAETQQVSAPYTRTYVHARTLNPGPNLSKRPDDDLGCCRGIAFLIKLYVVLGLLLWLVVWASHRWNF